MSDQVRKEINSIIFILALVSTVILAYLTVAGWSHAFPIFVVIAVVSSVFIAFRSDRT